MTSLPDKVISRLDEVMGSTPEQVGVAMGYELYGECRARGRLPMRTFSVLGLGFLPHELPAYRGKNFAFVHTDLTDWGFQIGKPNA